MIVIVAKAVVKAEEIEAYKNLAKNLVKKSRQENGCKKYMLYQDIKDKNTLTFIEAWENEDVIKAHNESDHFKTIVPQLALLQEKEAEVNLYEDVVW